MGLFNKIKGILFDEIEDEEEVVIKKEEEVKPVKEERKIAEKIEPQPKKEEVVKPAPEVKVEEPKNNDIDVMNERDLFKADDSFPFLDFDEEEFSNSIGTRKEKSTTNVLEYEKKRKTEKRYDLGRIERVETKEVVEKKKFKPSPIISPVYGILNEDYRIEDIKDKADDKNASLDFNSVRKKAFEEPEHLEEVKPAETYYEETVTVKLKDNDEEQQEKSRTIDELLEDTADVTINTDSEPAKTESREAYEEIDSDLEEVTPEPKFEEPKKDSFDNDDTLESDLFDLIDSMYDNREDGEN